MIKTGAGEVSKKTATDAYHEKFELRVSFKNTGIFFVLTGLFFFSGIFVYVMTKDLRALFIISGFAALMDVILVTQVLPIGTYYALTDRALILRRWPLMKRIELTGISEIRIVNEQEVPDILMEFQEAEYKKTREMDIKGAFGARFKLGRFIQFCTVPIVFNLNSASNIKIRQHKDLPNSANEPDSANFSAFYQKNINVLAESRFNETINNISKNGAKYWSKTTGQFVLVNAGEGNSYLLSPKDIELFIKTLRESTDIDNNHEFPL